MRIYSTSDISLIALRQKVECLPSEWRVDVSDGQFFMRAMDAPSWVSIAAEAPWWIQFFGGAATVYVTGFISEAGKDTWKNRSKLARFADKATSAVGLLADFIIDATAQASPKTFAVLAIPVGNGFDQIQLKLDYENQQELEFQIAVFVQSVPDIQALIADEGLASNAAGSVFLEFGANDYSLIAVWFDRETIQRKERLLSS